jgi:thioredoxin 1
MKSLLTEHRWLIVAAGAMILAGVVALSSLTCGVSPTARPAPSTREGETTSTDQLSNIIEHVQAGDFDEKVLRSAVPVLVDFYADWCPPCRALAPVLEQFARQTPEAKIVKVNVDENPALAARYQVELIPSLLVFREGRLTERHVGMANKELLRRLLSL